MARGEKWSKMRTKKEERVKRSTVKIGSSHRENHGVKNNCKSKLPEYVRKPYRIYRKAKAQNKKGKSSRTLSPIQSPAARHTSHKPPFTSLQIKKLFVALNFHSELNIKTYEILWLLWPPGRRRAEILCQLRKLRRRKPEHWPTSSCRSGQR